MLHLTNFIQDTVPLVPYANSVGLDQGLRRPSVRPSVCLSVCTSHFSHHAFYFANNSSSTDAIEMKLHMWIELKQVKSHAQDP